MTFSDTLFIAAGLMVIAAGGVGHIFAKSLQRRRINRATVAAGEKVSG